jgi:Uma2 family endonuclease
MGDTAARLDDLGGAGNMRAYAEQLLETQRVEYVDEGVVLVMAPAGFEHRAILEQTVKEFHRLYFTGGTTVDWMTCKEDFQWDLPDGSGRFYVPDLVIAHPGATTNQELREGIELVVEVTSPKSADTVYNDRKVKPKQYAKGGVPLYLLVDQKCGSWVLHGLAPGWELYQVVAEGEYGGGEADPVPLPEPFGFKLPTEGWPAYTSTS